MRRRSLSLLAYLAWSARAVPFAERRLARRVEAGKEDPARLDERRGIAGRDRPKGPLVWFHAASVGESLSILELIRQMLSERPGLSVLVTSGTLTSAQLMADRLPRGAFHQFAPLDTGPWVRRFLDHWHPDLAVWTESELWPTLMHQTHKRGIPMALINARMSEASFHKWRWLPGAAASLLRRFARVQAQELTTADFLIRLGVDRDRLEVTGTLKEGAAALPVDQVEHDRITGTLAGRPRWLAASTHPGEEDIVANAHALAARQSHRLLLILVPRHPERGDALAQELREGGFRVAQRSQSEPITRETQIYLADTLGEMGLWFRVAPVTLVGGSLVPIGGHNPFEPAALGSAILTGPHVTNFQDIFDRLRDGGALRNVSDARDLAKSLTEALEPDEAARMAHAAWEVVSDGAEVTDRAQALLFELLDA